MTPALEVWHVILYLEGTASYWRQIVESYTVHYVHNHELLLHQLRVSSHLIAKEGQTCIQTQS